MRYIKTFEHFSGERNIEENHLHNDFVDADYDVSYEYNPKDNDNDEFSPQGMDVVPERQVKSNKTYVIGSDERNDEFEPGFISFKYSNTVTFEEETDDEN